MERKFLFPHSWKKWGWIIAVPALVLLVSWLTGGLGRFDVDFDTLLGGLLDEVCVTLASVGLLLISFSETECEDEYVSYIRLRSLVWSVAVDYLLLIVATWCVYGLNYLYVAFASIFALMVLFVIKFHYSLWKLRRTGNEE